jgi:hypothetical protein
LTFRSDVLVTDVTALMLAELLAGVVSLTWSWSRAADAVTEIVVGRVGASPTS